MSPNFFLRLNINFYLVLGFIILFFTKNVSKALFMTTNKYTIIMLYMISTFMISQALYSYIALRSKDKLLKKKIFNVNILLLCSLLVIYSYFVIIMKHKHNNIITLLLMLGILSNYIALKIFRKEMNPLHNQNFVIFIA